MRADDVVKDTGGLITPQSVMAAILLVDPAAGQVGCPLEVAIDDRGIRHLRPHDPAAVMPEGVDQQLQVGHVEPDPVSNRSLRAAVNLIAARPCWVILPLHRLPLGTNSLCLRHDSRRRPVGTHLTGSQQRGSVMADEATGPPPVQTPSLLGIIEQVD